MRKLRSGWWWAVSRVPGAPLADEVVLIVHWDPADRLPTHGVKRIRLELDEAEELEAELRRARLGERSRP